MPHSGDTSVECRARDRIGCGELPSCLMKILRNLLIAELIVDVGTETRCDALGLYWVAGYAMCGGLSMTRRPGPDHHTDDETDMTEPTRAELVAEAAAIFGEEAARDLAAHLRVPFEAHAADAQNPKP